jgi:hypothetical protein
VSDIVGDVAGIVDELVAGDEHGTVRRPLEASSFTLPVDEPEQVRQVIIDLHKNCDIIKGTASNYLLHTAAPPTLLSFSCQVSAKFGTFTVMGLMGH